MERLVRLSGAVDAKDFRGCRCNGIGSGNYARDYRHPKNVRIRMDVTDQIPIATRLQIARDRGVRLPTNNLQRASANATITAGRIAAQRTNPTSGGTKQCTKVPVVGHSYTNSHSPELRDCNRSTVTSKYTLFVKTPKTTNQWSHLGMVHKITVLVLTK